jgi:hypothetical protein
MRFQHYLKLVVAALALSSVPAVAQYAPSPLSGIGFTNAMIFGEEQTRRSGAAPSKTGPTRTVRPGTIAVNLSYAPSATRRQANYSAYAAKSQKVDPAAAAKMRALFASTDVISAMQEPLAKVGLRIDNVADTFAIWAMQAWGAANNDWSDSSRAQAQAVKSQIARALASSSDLAVASDARKQELAESFLIQTVMISAAQEDAKNNPAMMRQLGAAVRKGAKASGLDLDAMTLTDQGFVPSGKTGAADPAPGAAEQALAANAAATPPVAANDTSPPYILLAAAGGAGLGGVFLLGKLVGKRG